MPVSGEYYGVDLACLSVESLLVVVSCAGRFGAAAVRQGRVLQCGGGGRQLLRSWMTVHCGVRWCA